MGANIFVFRFDESSLKSALDAIEQKKREYPGHTWGLEVSVELIPDGIGYETRDPQVKVVSEDETQCLMQMCATEHTSNMN